MTELKRTISLTGISLYGLGTILGAGIYVLIGKVAGRAGMFAPLSFLLAAVVAALIGACFAELCARIPKAAGEAAYIDEGFRLGWLSTLVGLVVALTGIVSAAVLARGFTGYMSIFVDVPPSVASTLLLVVLSALAVRGIAESVWVASVITLLEVGGLLLVLFTCGGVLTTLPERLPELLPSMTLEDSHVILLGGFLAFYAFIGFEDMVNMAEEVKKPERNLPLGIVIAIVVSSLLYLGVALTAVLSVTPEELSYSPAPLALLYERQTGTRPLLIGAISLFAVVNGGLVQMIMASRVLYGLAKRGQLPSALAKLHPKTQTPVLSTLLIGAIIVILSAFVPLDVLAEATSFLLLFVFSLITIALLRIKRRSEAPEGIWTVPLWLNVAACLACSGLVIFRSYVLLDSMLS